MRLNPKLPLSHPFMARIAAQAIVYHGFDMKRAVAELRPGLKCYSAFGAKLLEEPAVRREIEVIMSRTERNSQKFLKSMWDAIELYESYINDPTKGPPPKHVVEVAQSAMRILAKGYISEKAAEKPMKPFVIDGVNEGALTGEVKVQ